MSFLLTTEEQKKVQHQYEQRKSTNTNNKKRKRNNQPRGPPPPNAVFRDCVNAATYLVYANFMAPNEHVIDLACGPWTDGVQHCRLGVKSVLGVDLTKAAIDLAYERVESFERHPPPLAEWIQDEKVDYLPLFTGKTVNLCTDKVDIREEKANIVVCKNALHFLDMPKLFQHVCDDLLHPAAGYFIVLCVDSGPLVEKVVRNPPPWFHLTNLKSDRYDLKIDGLSNDSCTELLLPRKSVVDAAEKAGLKLLNDRSVWEVRDQLGDSFAQDTPVKWPLTSQLLPSEIELLKAYRFYVFVDRLHDSTSKRCAVSSSCVK